jgi:hypothetical protein
MKWWIVIALTACSNAGDRCERGTTQTCACAGGGEGTQACSSDGTQLLPCSCAPPADAMTNDAEATCGPGIYPCGPYGYSTGSTIENIALLGRRDSNANGHVDLTDDVVAIKLSDLVTADTQALVVVVCAQWCTECVVDQPNLNALNASYAAAGHVAFYDVIFDSAQPGIPADLRTVGVWGTQRNIAYPIAADPTQRFAPYFPEAAFPQHMIVRTSDMQIAYTHTGVDATLGDHIDAVLANP